MKTKSKYGFVGMSIIYLLLISFSMTFLVGCGNSSTPVGTVDSGQDPATNVNQNSSQPVQASTDPIPASANVSVDDLEAALEDDKGWQLIDVREPREFATGHIKMALNRPLANLENTLNQISKEKDIVLIDLNGSRAESGWHVLVEKGYDPNKVKVLDGGMLQWRGIVSSAGSSSADIPNGDPNAGGSNTAGPKPEVQEMVGGC
ncbi:rhodanese-like domain-containing protein [Desulfosporosinus sp.]|uniref:rhodanese-like domain-containing protein n=1 Tax=Desulfosporosinus sp. TaxID=157907 RepID=UPI0025C136DB|nr:rhodanese-like domain-containing protein [Desulfosporosinus sp.]MBC2723367.1 rhodanese-like domain-containing protein [Desulfosporosinus sp.]MBC2725028.1 rhodanese-like domain-containing protein [Desulfosporosinus sp.]